MGRTTARISSDSALMGIGLFGAGSILAYMELALSKDGGFVGRYICGSLYYWFNGFEWFIPATMMTVGFGMCVDSVDIFFAVAFGFAAITFLFLCSALFHVGSAGYALDVLVHSLFGSHAPVVMWSLIGVLAHALSNISEDRIIFEMTTRIANAWYALQECRLPSFAWFMRPTRRRKISRAKVDPSVPIAMPATKATRTASYVDAKFIDLDAHRAAHPSTSHRPPSKPVTHVDPPTTFKLPDLSILNAPTATQAKPDRKESVIRETLLQFQIAAEVVGTQHGPTLTRYEIKPADGVKIKNITALRQDLARALAAETIRIEAPIPGTSLIGIEIPTPNPTPVFMREILEVQRRSPDSLMIALGKDAVGKPISADLCSMPHLLVAGATGTGKSVCLNSIIVSLLMTKTPDQVRLLFIDPKRVELQAYDGLPHLLRPTVTDAKLASPALFELTKEMDARYERFAKASVRKIDEYNAKFPRERMPYIIVIIDELADLMTQAKKTIEPLINRLTYLARATGIHVILATQRPSVKVITGDMKGNVTSRIAFAVGSQTDSRVILDENGAETLLGRGDMLYLHGSAPKPVRIQGALVSLEEISRIVAFWRTQGPAKEYAAPETTTATTDPVVQEELDFESLVEAAARFVIIKKSAAASHLQTQFGWGNPKAVRIMNELRDRGIIGAAQERKPSAVMMTIDEFEAHLESRGEACQAA